MSFIVLAGARGSSAGGGAYSWADAVSGVPFTAPTQPTAPTTSGGSVSVTTATYASHINASKEMTFAAGTYSSDITLTGNDQKLILEDGVSITGIIYVQGAQRIEITYKTSGGTIRNPTIKRLYCHSGPTDIFVNGITCSNAVSDGGNIFHSTTRVFVLSSAFTVSQYCFWSEAGTSGLVVANCNLETTAAGGSATPLWRSQGGSNSILRGCRVANSSGSQSCHRIHADPGDGASTNHWMEGCQLEGPWGFYTRRGDGTQSPSDGSSNVWLQNNHCYGPDSVNFGSTDTTPNEMTNLNMTGNNLHSTGGAFPTERSGWDIGTSVANTISATATAPAWSYA